MRKLFLLIFLLILPLTIFAQDYTLISKLLNNSLESLFSYVNGIYFGMLFLSYWLITTESEIDNKRNNKYILKLFIIGLVLGTFFNWIFDKYTKEEIFSSFITLLVTMVIYKLKIDKRIKNILFKKRNING